MEKSKVVEAFKLFKEASTKLARARAAVIKMEERVKQAKARAYVYLREQAAKDGKKVTEKELEERVRLATADLRKDLADMRADAIRAESEHEIALQRLLTLRSILDAEATNDYHR